ncbi:serine/threonine-protein kinase TIO-like [Rutidosis leptorrhynchoides]|uniref:serine/threonine-protein kinase TIO-like n=1 Tax=Rutidosis leptorrhynchoides TaxID=125765 RepID=UPI003A990EDF
MVAVKRLSTKESKGGQGIKEFLTEIQLLSRYKHQNIVSLLGFCKQGDEKILIYEYAEHGSLDTYLSRACTFTWKQRINICIDAAYGLDHLHNHVSDNHRVIHRDIKSGNILLGHNLKAMIADLGLSKRGLTNDNDSYIVTHACGTDAYLDPEYRRTGILTKESDIYSFGVVLFEVLCGRLSYMNVQDNRRYLDQLARSSYKEHKLEEIIDPSLKDKIDSNSLFTYSKIAYECLLINRPERPAIATVVKQLKDALKFQDDMDKGPKLTNYEGIKDSPRDELTTNAIKKVLIKGDTELIGSTGENTSERKLEAISFQENWIPISLPESWDDGVSTSNQSEPSVVTKLVATGARDSKGVADEIFWEHMGITVNILRMKKSDYNRGQLHLLDDLLIKCFSLLRKLLDNNGGGFGDSYMSHWVAVVELYKEVTGCTEDASGRLVYESVTCIRIMISSVAQHLKASKATKHAEVATNTLRKMLDHAKALGVIDDLLSCVATCGKSLMSGSSNLLRAACEACEAIWSLIHAFEIHSTNEEAPVFPLSSMYSHSLDQINIRSLIHAFEIQSRKENEPIILRCCLHNDLVARVLCGLSSSCSSVVGGGGENTIISEVFSLISLCASFNTDPQQQDTNNLKIEVSDPSDLVLHACLLLATVAQSIDDRSKGYTAVIMLTSSPETQQSRLSDLAHHYSLCDGIQNFRPHSMSAMLALGYMCSLENNEPIATSIREIVVPLIPPSTTLCDYLRMSITDAQGGKLMLSYWRGIKDGCVVLLYFRLLWGGPLATIQDLGSCDIPQSLINLLGNKQQQQQQHSNEIGLSPLGVYWAVSSLHMCLKGGSSVFRQVLITSENVKIMCDLISDVHLKLLRYWVGPGGGKSGVKETVDQVVNLLRFPFEASEKSIELGDMDSQSRKDMVIEIKASMDQ